MTHALDKFGGTTAVKGTATGWFHLEKLAGRTRFITPEGNAFFPVSLAHPFTGHSQPTVQKIYNGDKDAWAEHWFEQLRELGFNCALSGVTSQCRDEGHYVDVEAIEALFRRESFPFAVGIFLIPHPNELPEGTERADIFSPAFTEWAEAAVSKVARTFADDPLVLGYYYGFGTFLRPESWIASIPSLDETQPLQENIRRMAVQLYRLVHDTIRRHDRNHLILGPYVNEQSFDVETWKAVAPYVDMLSPQHFSRHFSFAEQSRATGLPVLVSDEETGHIFEASRNNPNSVTPAHKGRLFTQLLNHHLHDPVVCGANFCATLYDLDEGPLMEKSGMLEGLYDREDQPKPGLVDAVSAATRNIYERATQPLGPSELAGLEAEICRTRDAGSPHLR